MRQPSSAQLLGSLLSAVEGAPFVVVQAHDYPDNDAIAAAFGVAWLLRAKGQAAIVAASDGGHTTLGGIRRLLASEGIALEPAEGLLVPEGSALVVIDACPGNANLMPLGIPLAGVIDHHGGSRNPGSPHADIRPSVGATCSIVWSYIEAAGLRPTRGLATALLAGIMTDTDFLTRHVSRLDLEAHRALYPLGDPGKAVAIVRKGLSLADLPALSMMLSSARVEGSALFGASSAPCAREAIAIMADFALRLKELSFAAIVAPGDGEWRVSARSSSPSIDARALLSRALEGLGASGGHAHMAGGSIGAERYPGDAVLADRIFEAIRAIAPERKAT
jgi:nanoRNase/pAp phosphatase (c-di-AMP/oligoRNAs hydrolase)